MILLLLAPAVIASTTRLRASYRSNPRRSSGTRFSASISDSDRVKRCSTKPGVA